MDVNTGDLSQKEFRELSETCAFKRKFLCEKTSFACKDYMCPVVESAKDAKDVREKFIHQ